MASLIGRRAADHAGMMLAATPTVAAMASQASTPASEKVTLRPRRNRIAVRNRPSSAE